MKNLQCSIDAGNHQIKDVMPTPEKLWIYAKLGADPACRVIYNW
jgi:hypothetical protein